MSPKTQNFIMIFYFSRFGFIRFGQKPKTCDFQLLSNLTFSDLITEFLVVNLSCVKIAGHPTPDSAWGLNMASQWVTIIVTNHNGFKCTSRTQILGSIRFA